MRTRRSRPARRAHGGAEGVAAVSAARRRAPAAVTVVGVAAVAVLSLLYIFGHWSAVESIAAFTFDGVVPGGGGGATKHAARKKKRRRHLYDRCPHPTVVVDGARWRADMDVGNSNRPSVVVDKGGGTKDQLVVVQKGTVPIIISVPHGADAKSERTTSWQAQHFLARPEGGAPASDAAGDSRAAFNARLARAGKDANTVALARDISDALERLCGGAASERHAKPYLVAARFLRRYVDVNRRLRDTPACCAKMDAARCTAVASAGRVTKGRAPEKTAGGKDIKATASPKAAAKAEKHARRVYLAYFAAIESILNELRRDFGPDTPVLLLDVHAQKAGAWGGDPRAAGARRVAFSAKEATLLTIAGTQDGRTVGNRTAFFGRGGFLGHYARALKRAGGGLGVYPPRADVPDHRRYNGGNIMSAFGRQSVAGARVDAVQLEFGVAQRMDARTRAKVAAAVASAAACAGYARPSAKPKHGGSYAATGLFKGGGGGKHVRGGGGDQQCAQRCMPGGGGEK